MKPPRRLLDPASDATATERRLLDAATPVGPSANARERIAARLARTLGATPAVPAAAETSATAAPAGSPKRRARTRK